MKLDTKLAGMIMALLVIVVLFIPAYANYEIEQRTVTHIATIEGLYENGTVIDPVEPVNKAHVGSLFTGETVYGAMANNDSIYRKYQGNEYINYTNFVTYIGDGNYTVTPNYTIQSTPFQWRSIMIPLNVTASEFMEFDFIRLTSNDEHVAKYIRFHTITSGGSRTTAWQQVSSNTYIITVTFGLKTFANDYPNDNIYIEWNGNTPTGLDDTDAAWTFKIEGFNLDPEHQFFWTDEHLFFGAIGVSLVIMSVAALFTTNFVDVKFDRNKRKW